MQKQGSAGGLINSTLFEFLVTFSEEVRDYQPGQEWGGVCGWMGGVDGGGGGRGWWGAGSMRAQLGSKTLQLHACYFDDPLPDFPEENQPREGGRK